MDDNSDWRFLVYLIVSAVLVVLCLVVWHFRIPGIAQLLRPITVDQMQSVISRGFQKEGRGDALKIFPTKYLWAQCREG